MAGIYILAAKFGLSLAFTTKQVTTIWPPTGIALAALLIWGYQYWPGVFIGALIANAITNEPLAVAAGIAAGNTLEALSGAYLLKRVLKFDPKFKRVIDFLGLLVLAAILSTTISATIGTFSLTSGGLIAKTAYASTWLVWWVGDMMGALIFAPLILVYKKQKLAYLNKNFIEAFILVVLTVVVSIVVFDQKSPLVFLPYLIFPFVIWASLRFAQVGAVTVNLLVAAVAIQGTLRGAGPFMHFSNIEKNLILLHTFILVVVLTSMLSAITVDQRQRVERMLRNEAEKLQQGNRRIRNLLDGALGKPYTKASAAFNSLKRVKRR